MNRRDFLRYNRALLGLGLIFQSPWAWGQSAGTIPENF